MVLRAQALGTEVSVKVAAINVSYTFVAKMALSYLANVDGGCDILLMV